MKDKPTLQRLHKTPAYDILFVDYDRHRAFAQKHGIYSLPFYFVVKGGKVLYKTHNLSELLNYEATDTIQAPG